MLGVGCSLFDCSFGNVAREGFIDVADAVCNVVRVSLCEHFDGSVGQIPDKAGQLVLVGYIKSRKAKADTLYAARKNYMFGYLTHNL